MKINEQDQTKVSNDSLNNNGNMKVFEMSLINNTYFNTFRDSKYPDWMTNEKQKASWLQYKSRVGNFLAQLNKSLNDIELEDITQYIFNKSNAKNHINGFMLFHIKENTLGFRDKVKKDILFYLLNV